MFSLSKSFVFALYTSCAPLLILTACSWREKEPIPTPVPTLAITLPTPLPTLPSTATPLPEPTAIPTTEPTVVPTAVVTTSHEATTTLAVTTTAELTTTTPLTTASVTTATLAPRIFFRQPTANAILPLTSTVIIGVEGLVVEPAGGSTPGAGHLHLLIDTDFVEPGAMIPKDEKHLHLHDGALETPLALTPGEHTLRLQFADGTDLALEGEQYQAEIPVFVLDGAPAQAVRFVQPSAGAVLSSTVEVIMAATGLVIEPAGEIHDNAGHLHILIDSDFTAPGDAIPNDETHLHLGNGQLTTTLELPPGEYTLRLQFANGAHIALEGEQYRDEIEVTVK